MAELFPAIAAVIMLMILSGLEIIFFKVFNRRWWQYRFVRIFSYTLPILGVVFIGIWMLGIYFFIKPLMFIAAALSALSLVLISALLLSLPVSGIINFIHDIWERRQKKRAEPAVDKTLEINQKQISRRKFLNYAAVIAPTVALGAGVSGVGGSFTDIDVYKKSIFFDDLADGLDGFKILQISDIHIGYYRHLEDVEEVIEAASKFSPDMIVATGDLSDRIELYKSVLDILGQLKTPYGVYACLGNHEYFRGITHVRRAFDKSNVLLLKDNGISIPVGNAIIYLAGADDPMFMRGDISGFLQATITSAVKNAPDGAFKLLLSHRPKGFNLAEKFGINLTLAGHTHGGQLGIYGQSAFELISENTYLWGLYEKGNRKLYTSSGVGHWFPFRLGCPAEAPIIELRKAK
ncbi:MAG: metallophosphoesterase [candidate division Zixibacteria bacterium]